MKELPVARLSSRSEFTGRIFAVQVDRVRLPNSREADMEVIRHPASVVLIPMPDAEHVVLIRQYRYALDRWIWELPAGSVDPGESPEAAASRECHEEIGKVPRAITRLGAFYPTPGYCDELMIYYRIDGLDEADTPATADIDECIEPHVFELAEARRLREQGEIVDMKTAVGLSLIK